MSAPGSSAYRCTAAGCFYRIDTLQTTARCRSRRSYRTPSTAPCPWRSTRPFSAAPARAARGRSPPARCSRGGPLPPPAVPDTRSPGARCWPHRSGSRPRSPPTFSAYRSGSATVPCWYNPDLLHPTNPPHGGWADPARPGKTTPGGCAPERNPATCGCTPRR